MKNKLNKKGFTLVELLAVIVVLAIIMVIATQQISGVIQNSRTDSFINSVLMIKKNATLLCGTSENGTISAKELRKMSGINETVDEEYALSIYTLKTTNGTNNMAAEEFEEKYSFKYKSRTGLIITGRGKFENLNLPAQDKLSSSLLRVVRKQEVTQADGTKKSEFVTDTQALMFILPDGCSFEQTTAS